MLNEMKAQDYWEQRAFKYGKKAVGFDCMDLSKQDTNYKEKMMFIFKYLDQFKPTIDYGCGVGRFARYFFPYNYCGVDMTSDLLEIAKRENPERIFILNEKPYFTKGMKTIESIMKQFFICTVLQHCDDDLVKKIFESTAKFIRMQNFDFVLYEKDNNDEKPHVVSRTTDHYKSLIKPWFNIKNIQSHSHTTHNEKHTLSIFSV